MLLYGSVSKVKKFPRANVILTVTIMVFTAQYVDATEGGNLDYLFQTRMERRIYFFHKNFIRFCFIFNQFNKFISNKIAQFHSTAD